jgi:uncharacterized membrane protein
MVTTPRTEKLPRHVEDAIKQISSIHRAHHTEARPSERLTDGAVSIIGTPTFLAVLFVIVAIWTGSNAFYPASSFDQPPFPILGILCSLTAIFLAVLILAAQRRDDRLATRREQMTLQVSLLTEQKVSKLIDLIEELRRDLPGVNNRVDLDAMEMTTPADHESALKSVEEDSKAPTEEVPE